MVGESAMSKPKNKRFFRSRDGIVVASRVGLPPEQTQLPNTKDDRENKPRRQE